MDTRFEWDPAKAISNRSKHGVSFELAMRAFADPFALSVQDRIEGSEYRWQLLGMVEGRMLLLVAHTVRDERDGSETIRIISARRATTGKGDVMSSRLSEKRIDFAAPPPLDAKLEAELAALEAMDEARIDTSDIAEQGDAFWRDAKRGRFYRPVKQSTTVRIDADVLDWLKAKGRGYQTRINAILREAMMRDEGKG